MNLKLKLHIKRHIPETRPLQPYVRPLAVAQPRYIVARPYVDVVPRQIIVHLRRHRSRLGYFLAVQPLPLQHIEEVRIPAEVELIGIVELHAPVHKQPREDAVDDGRPHLRLDVVADDRRARLPKAPLPVIPLAARYEHRDAVDKPAARRQYLLHIPLGGLLRPYRQVVYHHIHFALFQDARDVVGRPRRLLYDVRHIPAHAVVRHPALHRNARARHILKLHRIVRLGEYRLRQIHPHLAGVYVKRRHKVYIPHAVLAQYRVHQPRYLLVIRGVRVLRYALH